MIHLRCYESIHSLCYLFVGRTRDHSASALTPPVGWTMADNSRAVLDPAAPEKQEVWEFTLEDEACPRLVAALMKEGVAIERFGIEPNGHINLVGPDDSDVPVCTGRPPVWRWWAVLAGQEHVVSLTPMRCSRPSSPRPRV